MLHLIKYNLLVKVKNFATTFWPLIFPLLLGTMFYFAFGNIDDADFETVQVGIVKEEEPDTLFLMFLDQMENNGNHLIAAQELSGTAALAKLENEEISGIYYVGKAPSLTVAANCPHPSIWSVEGNPKDVKPAGTHYPGFPWRSYHQRNCTVFLCTDCNDLSLWLLYRIWLCYHPSG